MSSPVLTAVRLIESRIYLIRGQKVLLDADLAALYQVPTRVFNQAVKRSDGRFPEDFRFQLTQIEDEALRSQIVISNGRRGGRRYLPYAFTELGVSMLSSVLNSETAIRVNIAIMRTFVRLRQFLANNEELAQRLDEMERRQLDQNLRVDEHERDIEQVFAAIGELIAPTEDPNRRRIGFPTAIVLDQHHNLKNSSQEI